MSVLDRRTLNRALLARQLLLQRHEMPVLDALEHLVGLRAQEPLEPYVGLWSRLAGFQPPALAELLLHRRAVRTQFGMPPKDVPPVRHSAAWPDARPVPTRR